jgi:hypothetical protein
MKITCPKCQKKLAVKDAFAGQLAKCPACQAQFRIPPVAPVSTLSAPQVSDTDPPHHLPPSSPPAHSPDVNHKRKAPRHSTVAAIEVAVPEAKYGGFFALPKSPRTVLVCLIVLILFVVGYGLSTSFSLHGSESPKAAVVPPKEYDEHATYNKVHDNYSQFAGKELLVIGRVERLGKDEIGRTFMIMKDCTSFFPGKKWLETEYMVCYMKDPGDLARVFTGNLVWITGECSGVLTNGMVILADARITGENKK